MIFTSGSAGSCKQRKACAAWCLHLSQIISSSGASARPQMSQMLSAILSDTRAEAVMNIRRVEDLRTLFEGPVFQIRERELRCHFLYQKMNITLHIKRGKRKRERENRTTCLFEQFVHLQQQLSRLLIALHAHLHRLLPSRNVLCAVKIACKCGQDTSAREKSSTPRSGRQAQTVVSV